VGSTPKIAPIPSTTGSMVAMYGILSINAEKRTDAHTSRV
jgi:hypothetical protein